jgi:hypothetical protein
VVAEVPAWLREAVSVFGEECRLKLAGPGDREAAIRAPLESLLRTVGQRIGLPASARMRVVVLWPRRRLGERAQV